MEIACKASGLVASVQFSQGHAVTGSVDRLIGSGSGKYCTLDGHWNGKISVACEALVRTIMMMICTCHDIADQCQ